MAGHQTEALLERMMACFADAYTHVQNLEQMYLPDAILV